MAIFLTSDTHFGHDRGFIWQERGFQSVEEMNQAIVKNWNSVVSPEDEVYHLGDVMLGDNEAGMKYLKMLNGKITIIRGNHDTDRRIAFYKENGYEVKEAMYLSYKGYHFFLTHFPCLTGNLEKESLKQVTCNLYGHTHQKNNFYEDIPYMYHVGVDSHNCTPVALDTIIKEMNKTYTECIDFLDLIKEIREND